MFSKVFLSFCVVLFAVCLIILIFHLAFLHEARFELNGDKFSDGECSFTSMSAIVFSNGGNETFTPLAAGLLRIITASEIKENGVGKELVIETKPCWLGVFFFCICIIFFACLLIKKIFKSRF